ncbi:hypothetical protein [Tichowtungia aerotolerans]|uniref:Uncharacterized protein n=1 Tax=Tichowtungia aerotolerans TaxID=2697043 RepID=A0A6P1M5I6_9BACT|nr:hypothetical protein [Tichowtungia aerotolerans]QHI69101.1 hypothetical protein GT409_06455 [Tichowtungia aerotolerans]
MRSWSSIKACVTVACVLFLVSSAMGTLVAWDNFDYPLGTTVAAGGTLGAESTNGFNNAWKFTTHSGEVVDNLEFPGVASSGNALKVTRNTGGSLFRGMSSSPAGTYYVSMIFFRNDTNDGGGENWRLELRHSASYSGIETSSIKYQIGSSSTELAEAKAAGASASSYGTKAYAVGSPVFVLAKVEISDSGSDTVSMKWYNSLDLVPTSDSGIEWDAVSVGEFVAGAGWKLILPLYIGEMIIDEFRVGTELVDVVPAGGPSLLVYDNFDYTLGTTIATNGTMGTTANGFANGWLFDGYSAEVVSNLNFSGVESSGNALKLIYEEPGHLFRGMLSPLSAGTYYMSTIFFRDDVNDGGGENWRWEVRHSSSHSSGPASSVKVSLGSTSGEQVDLQVAGDAAQVGAATYNIGAPVLMLAKITIDESGAEIASMKWYNIGDTLPTEDSGIVWDATSTGEFSGGSGWLFALGQYNQEFTIDEFRLGRTVSSVVPAGPVFSGYELWSAIHVLQEGPFGDDDADGLSNLYEYGLGGDPTNSADQGVSPEVGVIADNGTNWFSYVHPALAHSNSGVSYSLELTDDLIAGSWTNIGYAIAGTNVTGGALNYVSNRVSTLDADQQFIRLIVEQQ